MLWFCFIVVCLVSGWVWILRFQRGANFRSSSKKKNKKILQYEYLSVLLDSVYSGPKINPTYADLI